MLSIKIFAKFAKILTLISFVHIYIEFNPFALHFLHEDIVCVPRLTLSNNSFQTLVDKKSSLLSFIFKIAHLYALPMKMLLIFKCCRWNHKTSKQWNCRSLCRNGAKKEFDQPNDECYLDFNENTNNNNNK